MVVIDFVNEQKIKIAKSFRQICDAKDSV